MRESMEKGVGEFGAGCFQAIRNGSSRAVTTSALRWLIACAHAWRGAAAGDEEHANGFALAGLARLGEMFAAERLVGGADGVELLGLGAGLGRSTSTTHSPCSSRNVVSPAPKLPLDSTTSTTHSPCSSRNVVSPAPKLPLDSTVPVATVGRVLSGETQHAFVADRVGREGDVRADRTAACGLDGSGVRLAVRVDPDDVVDQGRGACAPA
jgi:hypothetical protein